MRGSESERILMPLMRLACYFDRLYGGSIAFIYCIYENTKTKTFKIKVFLCWKTNFLRHADFGAVPFFARFFAG